MLRGYSALAVGFTSGPLGDCHLRPVRTVHSLNLCVYGELTEIASDGVELGRKGEYFAGT